MTSIELSTLIAVAVLSLAYIIKRKFWPTDAPPPKPPVEPQEPPQAS